MSRSPKEKDPRVLLTLALEGDRVRRDEGSAAFAAWVAATPEFCHEDHPGKPLCDLVERLIALAKMPCVWTHMHLMPRTGRATLRELHKLTSGGPITRNEQLKSMLERGTVNPRTTREDVDNIRSVLKMQAGHAEVAPRHRGQRT